MRRTKPTTASWSGYQGGPCLHTWGFKLWRALFILTLLIGMSRPVESRATTVGVIQVEGPISPATADYVKRAIAVAEKQQLEALVIRLDTPGGLLDSTKDIVQALFAAKVPVVVHVAPSGARAASAGTFITLAADVAAMAPTTTIGAAHPVTVGGGASSQGTNAVIETKIANYAASFIESIASKRDRNVQWAISAVRDSAAITAEQALKLNVIEIVAEDQASLFQQLDGRNVNQQTLHTAGATAEEIPMLFRERFFSLFWRPEVLLILMMIAIYGIVGEVSNPGAIFPGVIGVIALIVALYMSAVLPVNIAGVALIILAVLLFVAEIFTPSFGLLTAGGIASFIVGALMLSNDPTRAFHLSLPVVIPAALLTAAFFLFVIGAGLRAQWLPVRVGKETLVGKTTTASTSINTQNGHVWVEGEYWKAMSESPVNSGEAVEIVGSNGLTLKVKPKT